MANFGDVDSSTALIRSIPLSVAVLQKGATAPTDAEIGATPTVPALLFDAANELINIGVMLPDDMDKTVDANLILAWSLVDAETDLDEADAEIDYVVGIENSTGNGVDKTSTNVTDTIAVTTGNGLAVNDIYTFSFAIPAADANNPLTNGLLFAGEFHLTNILEVVRVHGLGSKFNYEALY